MRLGKLNANELQKCVLDVIKHRRPEVKSGAALGEDCASFQSDEILLISTDPITGASKNLGSLAIKVASNDIYAAGGEPFLAMITIIAPPEATTQEISDIMKEAEMEAYSLDIEIAGGHTEFSDAVTRFVINVVIVGKTKKQIKSTSLNVGDSVIVTKTVGMEGSVILADKYETKLNLTELEKEELLQYSRCISLSKEGEALKEVDISSMHDITEGGVFGAIAEMCEGAGKGCLIKIDKIPITPLTKKICDKLGVNPYFLISSGSMIITTSSPSQVLKSLRDIGIYAEMIGDIREGKPKAVFPDGRELLLEVKRDELFFNC